MSAREPSDHSGPDGPGQPDQNAGSAPRGEIQALLDSPELRRIFDGEPAKIRSKKAKKEAAASPRSTPDDLGRDPVRRRSSRRRRVLVGLIPLYLGGVILFLEAVREPPAFLQIFEVTDAAEAAPARAGAAVLASAAPGERAVGPVQSDSAPAEVESGADRGAEALRETQVRQETPARAAAPQPALSAEPVAAKALAQSRETSPIGKSVIDEKTVVTDKAAIDLAKRPAGRIVQEPEQGPEGAFAAATDDGEASGDAEVAAEISSTILAEAPVSVTSRPLIDIPYPDPQAGDAAVVPADPAAAEAAEEALRLSRSDRREVQRRLRFAASDPELIDGIFGPATRTAIAAWQERAGLPSTGFVDEASMALLVEQTADEYRAWRRAERARAREREEQSAVVVTSAPPLPQQNDDACRRTASGEIAFGPDTGCNFRAFKENFKKDFSGLKSELRRLFD